MNSWVFRLRFEKVKNLSYEKLVIKDMTEVTRRRTFQISHANSENDDVRQICDKYSTIFKIREEETKESFWEFKKYKLSDKRLNWRQWSRNLKIFVQGVGRGE